MSSRPIHDFLAHQQPATVQGAGWQGFERDWSLARGLEKRVVPARGAERFRRPVTPGESVLAALFPNRAYGWPGGWSQDRLEQVQHMRNWTYIAIDCIASKVGQLVPNLAHVYDQPIPGKTQKYSHSSFGRYGGSTHHQETLSRVDGNSAVGIRSGDRLVTRGSYYRKALSVVKPHEELEPLDARHKLRELIDNPNPIDTSYDLFYELAMFLELTGVAYLWCVPNRLGKPCELWVLPSHWVWPRTGYGTVYRGTGDPLARSARMIDYYEVRPWGGMGSAGILCFPEEEVIAFRKKSPVHKIDGYSPLMACAPWMDTEESVTKSEWAQMQNIARPELFVKLGENTEDLDDNDIRRIEQKFQQKFGGELNYGKPIIGTPGMELTPIGYNPTDMAYASAKETLRDQILAVFRVPKMIAGVMNDMTYGSILAAMAGFCEFSINYRLAMLGLSLSKFLAPKFGDDIRIWYDDCAPPDPAQVNSDLQADWQMLAVTPDEVRAIRGRPPYEKGGNNPYTQGPGGMTPMPFNGDEDNQELAEMIAAFNQTAGTGEQQGQQPPENAPGTAEQPANGVPVGEGAGNATGDDLTQANGVNGHTGKNRLMDHLVREPNGKPTKGLNGVVKAKPKKPTGPPKTEDYPISAFEMDGHWFGDVADPDGNHLHTTGQGETRQDAEWQAWEWLNRKRPWSKSFTNGHHKALDSQGGEEPTNPAELQRAKAADLITLPEDVPGTNCGNCRFVKEQGDGHFCTHPKVQLPVTERNCCLFWDNEEALRAWGGGQQRKALVTKSLASYACNDLADQIDRFAKWVDNYPEWKDIPGLRALQSKAREAAGAVRSYGQREDPAGSVKAAEGFLSALPGGGRKDYEIGRTASQGGAAFGFGPIKSRLAKVKKLAAVIANAGVDWRPGEMIPEDFYASLNGGVTKDQTPWDEVPQQGPVAAGLAVVAADTGRVLLLQRQYDQDDPNAGKWEFPGGKRDEDEHPLETALREWCEEVGLSLPEGNLDRARQWVATNGKYQGFVYRVPSEQHIDLLNRRADGDQDSGGYAVVAWVDPRDLPQHNLRPALLADVDDVLAQVAKYLTGGRVVRKGKKRV